MMSNQDLASSIGGIPLQVAEASILVEWTSSSQFDWVLNIQFQPTMLDGIEVSPRLYSECLYGLSGSRFEQWNELSGKTLKWSECLTANGIPNALIYCVEHGDVYKATLRFGAVEGAEIELSLKAECDVFCGNFWQSVPLQISARISFLGARIGNLGEALSPEVATMRLRQIFPLGGFEYQAPKSSNYAPMMIPI